MLYVIGVILTGVFFGTFCMAWAHELVHKYRLFNISLIWKYHALHHQKNDPEYELKKKNICIVEYAFLSTLRYLNPLKWTVLDFIVFGVGCYVPFLGLSFLFGIFVAEHIGYLQHAKDNTPVDFTNKFCNKWGLGCGHHAEHHRTTTHYSTDTNVLYGLLVMYIWASLSVFLYPLLLLVDKDKANYSGVYCFGLIQNMRNYKHRNGISMRKLLHRMPSIFDKPKLLGQYTKLMFNSKPLTTEFAHDISQIRNIYNFTDCKEPENVVIYKGTVYDGHHRLLSNRG